MDLSPISALKPFGALTGDSKVNRRYVMPVETPLVSTGGTLAFGSSNGTGEIVSDYGASGASAGAYKGLSNNPNDTVGAVFDTARLGLYGY